MHELVLEDGIRRLRADQTRNARIFDFCGLQCAHHAFVAEGGKRRNRSPIGPVGAAVEPRLVERAGIDAALEEPLECRVDRRFAERPRVEREEAERRNMAFIECKRMAQRDRAIVERRVVDEGEELRRALAVTAIALEKVRAIEGESGSYSVPRLSCSRSIETKSALKFPFPNERLPLR
jgi:hypothetical protein